MAEKALEIFNLENSKIISRGGGDISRGVGVETENGRLFVKFNFGEKIGESMFRGEFHGLKSMRETECSLIIPEPIRLDKNGILMEFLNFGGRIDEYKLGVGIAQLHLHNRNQPNPAKFGYNIPTCCGAAEYSNDWSDYWPEYYFNHRLEKLVSWLNNKDLFEKFEILKTKKEELFTGAELIPSLVHGDLWSGNYAQTANGPSIFDPACFYAHDEFEFGMISLYGGLGEDFMRGYRSLVAECIGFERRVKLYRLFHLLNHWHHFGGSYKQQSLSLLDQLIK